MSGWVRPEPALSGDLWGYAGKFGGPCGRRELGIGILDVERSLCGHAPIAPVRARSLREVRE